MFWLPYVVKHHLAHPGLFISCLQVLESMQGWPLVNRNKVVDSGIMRKVEDLCTKSEGEAETDSGYPELVTVPAKKVRCTRSAMLTSSFSAISFLIIGAL